MGDLQHPNEYIRGSTLRFLCKLREAELLEPLLPSARACLVCVQGPKSFDFGRVAFVVHLDQDATYPLDITCALDHSHCTNTRITIIFFV